MDGSWQDLADWMRVTVREDDNNEEEEEEEERGTMRYQGSY